MECKVLELRDSATFIPVLAVDMNATNDGQRYLLRRCGYPCDGEPNVILTRADGNGTPATNDPYHWQNTRTWRVAHDYIIDHWHELEDGDVVDVQFILGETKEKKVSERFDRFTWGEGDVQVVSQPKGKTLAELDAEEQEKGEDR